jgi:hypothetical protein
MQSLPVDATERDSYVIWDLCDWEGDVETLEEINEAWMDAHKPPEKTGTISVFPEGVVIGGELQGFISEGWNEAAEAVGLQYLALVGDGLQGMAVRQQLDMPNVEIEVCDSIDEAEEWMKTHTGS